MSENRFADGLLWAILKRNSPVQADDGHGG